jgi:tryptophan synthase alpha chain
MQLHEQLAAAIESAAPRTAIVAYITAGYPEKDRFGEHLLAAAEAADVLEIGVPFTDPMADGLTIQRASQGALAAGVTLRWILDEIGALPRPPGAPLVLMSYLNPLLAFGYERLARRAAEVGVAGFIVPDLPLDESGELDAALAAEGLALIQLVTPVTRAERLAASCRASRGFVYAVTVTGITGGRVEGGGIADYLERVRARASVPVCAGFGVRSPEQVAEIGRHVPGVVVGSALVEALERGEDPGDFVRWLRGERAPAPAESG